MRILTLFTFIICQLIFSSAICQQEPDCKFYYTENYHNQWDSFELNIGEDTTVLISSPSFKVLNENAAGVVKHPFPPSGYSNMFIYSERDVPKLLGTSQYINTPLNLMCIQKDIPQPQAFVPVDGPNANWNGFNTVPIVEGHCMLVVKKAYFWENAEDIGCPHGPWGFIGVHGYPSFIGENYTHEVLQNNIGIYEDCNDCLYDNTKLPGPIWFADEDCLANTDDAYNEWVDGPWGCCYSNIAVFDWDKIDPPVDKATIICTEADDTWSVFGTDDDFLGSIVIDRNEEEPILFKVWSVGWIILQNVKIPTGGEPSVEVGEKYWFYDWDGTYPQNAQLETQYQYDQYRPFNGQSIDDMESAFLPNTTVGLMGSKFPIGILDKPMTYKAACESAIFND